jgi:DNA-binding NarL/FixJ family response regulator
MIKILIVEDMPIVREGIRLIIGKISNLLIVGEYSNGKEFIDNLSTIDADIILMDIDLPEMDGITATKIAHSLRPELKIIALSLLNDRKYYYEMITAGAKGFVLKQAHSKELENAIIEVYTGGNYFSPELLRTIIIEMQGIETAIVEEKKQLLNLSQRDTEILRYLCQGLTNQELADKLFVSLRTIEAAKSRLMQKTFTKNNAGLVTWAFRNKVVSV